jgi:cytochrome c oxidase cbb3-type subunit 2/cytochrome c oxidase cbb3-type subunit I/II
MQPLFPQQKWEETVDKMAKVYGAQMDPEQRQSVIGYLVATHGPNSRAAPAPSSDEEPDLTSTLKPLDPGSGPPLRLATDPLEHAAEVIRGVDLFRQNCAPCHGNAGRGDGFISPVLLPRPENLAAIRFSLPALSDTLWNGEPGSAMPSWRSLPLRDLAALAAYVQNLHPTSNTDQPSRGALEHGRTVFLQNCAPCHGVSADGKGVAAATLNPRPANFKLKQPDFDYILQVVRDGIPGTAMPSWKAQLSESDRAALARFVRSVFEDTNSRGP